MGRFETRDTSKVTSTAMARRRSTNERYHDRVAPRYEEHHETDPYLSFCREISWRHLKRFLPTNASATVLDAGCGTGHYGIKLRKSGYRVDFQDLSLQMLDRARKAYERGRLDGDPRFVHGDLEDGSDLPKGEYDLIVAQGDILSFVKDPRRCMSSVAGLLRDGGVFLASMDQRYAGIEHYLAGGELDALSDFVKTGRTEWLAKDVEDRFPTRSFTVSEARKLFEGAGLRVESVLGRTILPLHRNRGLLDDREARRKLLAIEEKMNRDESALGRASHLEVAGRKSPRRTD